MVVPTWPYFPDDGGQRVDLRFDGHHGLLQDFGGLPGHQPEGATEPLCLHAAAPLEPKVLGGFDGRGPEN